MSHAASVHARALPGRLARAVRTLRRRLSNKPRQTLQLETELEILGSDYAGYAVSPRGLGPESIVYSFGVGEDVSFDVALIARFSLEVHAFDPTPKSIAWVAAQTLPAGLRFHALGVAAHDGSARFRPPLNPNHVSYTLVDRRDTAAAAIQVPVRRVSSIMRELGHPRLDLLKLDIEGAEYDVIEDLMHSGPYPTQILLEYHHQLKGVRLRQTERSIATLNQRGYRIIHESARGREFSLLRAPR